MSKKPFSFILFVSLVAWAILVSPASAQEIIGEAGKVVDGDTLYVCDAAACHKIRLCGIDAPEKGDIRYKSSRSALRDLATGRQIRCVRVGDGSICDGRSKKTNHDRIVAQCFIGKTDIADVLVARGYACDWVRFSGGHYSKTVGRAICDK
jgi:micrococcal nuclease